MNEEAKIYIGCDPGQSGGFVVLTETGYVIEVFKTPETRKEFINRLMPYKECHCFCLLEKVGCRPTNGAKANYTFGVNVERLLHTLEQSQIAHQEITPQSWMKSYMMKKSKEETHTQWKNRLKAKAEQLFPKEKITLWNSDAFLIAEYARRNFK